MKKPGFPLLLLPSLLLFSWNSALPGKLIAPPAQGLNGTIYAIADDRALHAIAPQNGRTLWRYRTKKGLEPFLMVSPDGSVLILEKQNTLLAFSPGGQKRWGYQLPNPLEGPGAIGPYGTIYLPLTEKRLISLSRWGKLLWESPLPEGAELYGTSEGLLLSAGEELTLIPLGGKGARPLEGEMRYATTLRGKLYLQNSQKSWSTLDLQSLRRKTLRDSPFEGLTFPPQESLITYEGRWLRGWENWSLASRSDRNTSSYYQEGGSPSRNRGMGALPRSSQWIKQEGQSPAHLLLRDGKRGLKALLTDLEEAGSLEESLSYRPDQVTILYDLLTITAPLQNLPRPPLGTEERREIYQHLTRWGNIHSQAALLELLKEERDRPSLLLLLKGLEEIGLDREGTALRAVKTLSWRFFEDTEILQEGIRVAAALARYNGNKRELAVYLKEIEIRKPPLFIWQLIQEQKAFFTPSQG